VNLIERGEGEKEKEEAHVGPDAFFLARISTRQDIG
jgi:hypothetical protein